MGGEVRQNDVYYLLPFSCAIHCGGFKRGFVYTSHAVKHIIPYYGQNHEERDEYGQGVCFYPYERKYYKGSHGNSAHEVQKRREELLKKFESVRKHRAKATEHECKQKARDYSEKRAKKRRAELFRSGKGKKCFKRFLRRRH